MDEHLFREYELNEKYHDTKENRAWIAGAFYLTYSLLFVQWLLQSDSQGAIHGHRWLIILFTTLLDISFFLFVLFQLHRKAQSVRRAGMLKYAIANRNNGKDKSLWSTIVWKDEIATDENLKGYFPGWLSLYKIELPLLFGMFLLYSVKVYFLLERLSSRYALFCVVHWPQLFVLTAILLVAGLLLGLSISHLIDRRRRKVLTSTHKGK